MEPPHPYGAIGLNPTSKLEETNLSLTEEQQDKSTIPDIPGGSGPPADPEHPPPEEADIPPAVSNTQNNPTPTLNPNKSNAPKKSSGKPAPKQKPPQQPCGIPDVTYTLDTVKKLDTGTSYLAGALRLETSSDIWDLYKEDKSTKPWLDRYIADRGDKFGWTPPLDKKYDTLNPRLLGTIWSDLRYKAVLLSPTCPRQGDAEVTERLVTTLGTAWYSFQLMRSRPDLFPKSSLGSGNVAVEAYDWLHAWKLLSYIRGQVSKGIVPTTSQHGRPLPPEIYNDPAAKPQVIGPPVSNPTEYPVDEILGFTQEEFVAYRDAFDSANLGDDQNLALDNESLDRAADLVRELSKSVEKSLDARQQRDIIRAPMTAAQRQHLIRLLVEKSDQFQAKGILFEPASTIVPLEAANRSALVSQVDQPDVDDKEGLDEERLAQLQKAREYIRISANPGPSFEDACENFGINRKTQLAELDRTGNESIILKRHQVTGVKFMQDQEQSKIGGGIIADSCGLGKTTQMLAYLALSTRLLEKGSGEFKPTLILCPPSVIDTWFDEWQLRFQDIFNVRLFHGSRKHTSNVRRANAIIDNIDELRPWLEVLDRTDPNTARTIILSSYQTWAKRTTCEDTMDHGEATPQTSRPKRPKVCHPRLLGFSPVGRIGGGPYPGVKNLVLSRPVFESGCN